MFEFLDLCSCGTCNVQVLKQESIPVGLYRPLVDRGWYCPGWVVLCGCVCAVRGRGDVVQGVLSITGSDFITPP